MAADTHVGPDYGAQLHPRDLDRLISRVAESQHGVVARSQLLESGMGRRAIGYRLEQGRLHVIHRGVYAAGHRVISREGRWMAAALAAGSSAALRRRSAASLWGIRHWDSNEVELVANAHQRTRPGIRVLRCAIPRDEITQERGIPVTTPARTLLDLASILNRSQLERAIDEAEIRRLDGPLSLEDLVNRHPRAPGTATLRKILADGQMGEQVTRSELEDQFLALLDQYRLPRPRVNASVETARRNYEVDCLWTTGRLIVELDGRATHATRRAFEQDRARDRALTTAGWRTIRITWRQLHEDPTTLAGDLATLLD